MEGGGWSEDHAGLRRARANMELRASATEAVALAARVFQSLADQGFDFSRSFATETRISQIASASRSADEAELIPVLILALDPHTEPEMCAIFDTQAMGITVALRHFKIPPTRNFGSGIARAVHAVLKEYESKLLGVTPASSPLGSPVPHPAGPHLDFEAWLASDV